MWLPPFILHTEGILPLLLKTYFLLRRKDNCLLGGLAHLSHNSLSASFSKKTPFYSSVHSSKSVEVPWSTGQKSFPLTCPHAVICMSGAIKSSLPQMGFYTYIALARVRKKRQIRSSLLLDMPRSDNHETRHGGTLVSKGFTIPLLRWKCSPQLQHKVHSASDTLFAVGFS